LETLRDSFPWEGRYKPTVEELAYARDVAEAVARAMMIGSERSWKAIADVGQIVRGTRTLRDRIRHQVEAVASAITLGNASKPRNDGRIRVGAARDPDVAISMNIYHLHLTLTHLDPAFAQVEPYKLRREIAAARQGGTDRLPG